MSKQEKELTAEEIQQQIIDGYNIVIYPEPISKSELWMIKYCADEFKEILSLEVSRALEKQKEEVIKLRARKDELVNMLEDVVNELDLSDLQSDKHGPLATPPAELVRLVLEEKNQRIRMLKAGFKEVSFAPEIEKQKGEIDRLLSKLLQYEFAYKSEKESRILTEGLLIEAQGEIQTLRDALQDLLSKVPYEDISTELNKSMDRASSTLSSTSHNSKEETK